MTIKPRHEFHVDAEKVQRLYKQGLTVATICERLGVSKTLVRERLGLDRSRDGNSGHRSKKHLNDRS